MVSSVGPLSAERNQNIEQGKKVDPQLLAAPYCMSTFYMRDKSPLHRLPEVKRPEYMHTGNLVDFFGKLSN